ncbi:hypothetical protein NPIL_278701 [Nephila pilipes]|uniref:Uncharacterized protein n=1 Tax=Nephila pilipes TaxID=299642 RepID=A0A8X6R5V0_NEPPI|nr:hypothetical protein NPIL_610411 [Nephila pilipes]GFT77735.1 hypothetical protein NPIL_550501 [Nephila pilipes]GFU34852.1 hypothetical protein NPIL_314211 [Nephila pilipes]GFU62958.1 hypothetical protein NPIL_278701 [Nephila pilipes]
MNCGRYNRTAIERKGRSKNRKSCANWFMSIHRDLTLPPVLYNERELSALVARSGWILDPAQESFSFFPETHGSFVLQGGRS